MKFEPLINKIIGKHDDQWLIEMLDEFRKNKFFNPQQNKVIRYTYKSKGNLFADRLSLKFPEYLESNNMTPEEWGLVRYCWDNPFYSPNSDLLPTLKSSFDELYEGIKSVGSFSKTYYYRKEIAKEVNEIIISILKSKNEPKNPLHSKCFVIFKFLYELDYRKKIEDLIILHPNNKTKRRSFVKRSIIKVGSASIKILFELKDESGTSIVTNNEDEIEKAAQLLYSFFDTPKDPPTQVVNLNGDKFAISFLACKLCVNAGVSTKKLECANFLKINGEFINAQLLRKNSSRFSSKKHSEKVIKEIERFVTIRSSR